MAPQVLQKFHVRLNYAALKVMPNKTKKGKKQNERGKQAGGQSIQYYLRSDSSRTRNSSSNMTETGDKTSTPREHGHLVNQDDSKIQFGEVISNFQSSINQVISEFKSMMIHRRVQRGGSGGPDPPLFLDPPLFICDPPPPTQPDLTDKCNVNCFLIV